MKILSGLLALLLLAGMLISCSTPGNGTGTESTAPETSSGSGTASETTLETESDALVPDDNVTNYYRNIPDGKDLGGYTFKFFSYDYRNQGDHNLYLAPTTEGNGNKIQAASFYRNIEVEQTFRCKITLDYDELWTTYIGTLSAQIKSGDAPWDLCCFYGSTDHNIASLISQGLLLNWNNLPYVNLSELWYNQSANEAYSILGKQFLAVSEITRVCQGHSFMLMNQSLFVDYKHEVKEIYDTVNSGNWTYAALDNYIQDTYRNTNATEPGKDAGDTFGMVINSGFAGGFVTAAGEIPVRMEEDHMVYNFSSTRISNIVKKAVDYCYNDNNVWFEKATAENNYNSAAVIYSIFNEGRSLFSFYASDIKYLLEISAFDYSYLPYPKYNTKQTNYVAIGGGGIMGVPRNVESRTPDATGTVIEALSAASRKYVYKKYLMEYFETRVLRDPESLRIYTMMANNTVYSLGKYVDPTLEVDNYFAFFPENHSLGVVTKWREKSVGIRDAYEKLLSNVRKQP